MNDVFRKPVFRDYYVPGSELKVLHIPFHGLHFVEEDTGAQKGPVPYSVPMPTSACHHALLKQTTWGIHGPAALRMTKSDGIALSVWNGIGGGPSGNISQ